MVVKRLFSPGSKSEHLAVMLDTGEERFRLRFHGGDSFFDPELEKLVGRRIECEGIRFGQTFIITKMLTIDEHTIESGSEEED